MEIGMITIFREDLIFFLQKLGKIYGEKRRRSRINENKKLINIAKTGSKHLF